MFSPTTFLSPGSGKLTIACLCILTCVSGHASAQSGNFVQSDYYSNQIPKTPEAAFGTFGGVPINGYTGLPEISFTLMTLTSRELSVPVTVTYDATGVRTDELSTEVGMKWQIMAGGFVTREMNSLPDDDPNKGIWKYATSNNYFQNVNNPRDWVSWTERGDRDARPDEFTAVFNGRSVRFVVNKYRQVITIPRSNVRISCELLNSKIHKFTITAEDGTQYVFGGTTYAIEERKIENFSVRTKIGYGEFQTEQMLPEASETERSIDFFNTKWYLVSIKSATGDQVNFNYLKGPDCKYVTKTSTHRMRTVTVQVRKYPPNSAMYETEYTAVRKFSNTDPGKVPGLKTDYPYPYDTFSDYVLSTDYDNHFKPSSIWPYPGGLVNNVALVTTKSIRLNSITAATGARISFISSEKEDMPKAYRYDKIELFNQENTLVKGIRLAYQIVNATTTNDYMTGPESILASKIPDLPGHDSYWAYQLQQFSETSVSDARYRKYVYEGIKPHNYKRLFLASIVDVTSGTDRVQYTFAYNAPERLQRRTTPVSSKYGYHRTGADGEQALIKASTNGLFNTSTYTRMANVVSPSAGMTHIGEPTLGILVSIGYATGGKTMFAFDGSGGYPLLTSVQDMDERGESISTKQVEYLDQIVTFNPVYLSYQESRLEFTNDWVKYAIMSSTPQNSATLTKGSVAGNRLTRIYNGTRTNHAGWEEFTYTSPAISTDAVIHSEVVPSVIKSDPVDTDRNGEPITNGITDQFPFSPPIDNDHLRGLLARQETFDAAGKKISSIINEYDVNPAGYNPQSMYGFHGGSFVWTSESRESFDYGYASHPQYRCRYSTLKLQSDWIVLSKTIQTTHDQSAPAITTSMVAEYTYDPANMQLVQTKSYNAAHPALSTTTFTKYATHSDYNAINETTCDTEYEQCASTCSDEPDEYVRSACYANCQYLSEACLSNPPPSASAEAVAIHQMRTQHQVAVPIETQVVVDEGPQHTLVGAVVYKFQKYKKDAYTSFAKPKEVWAAKAAVAADSYTSSYVDDTGTFVLDNTWLRKMHTFDTYDAATGNILQQTTFDGVVSSYQWGHNSALVTGFTINPGVYGYQYNYAYKPGVGLTNTTDPNGIKNYYEYDPGNRLRLTRDYDQNILTRVRYHYAAEKPFAPEFSFAICADGPVKVDISAAVAPVPGACTSTDASGTYLKVSVSDGCGPFSYTWEYQTGDNNWAALGTGLTTSVPTGFANRTIGTYTVRCTATDNCGKSMISPTLLLTIFNSKNPD